MKKSILVLSRVGKNQDKSISKLHVKEGCQFFLNFIVWLRITDEGSVPEMRIWSILLIKSD